MTYEKPLLLKLTIEEANEMISKDYQVPDIGMLRSPVITNT